MSAITFLSLFRKYIEYNRSPDLINEIKRESTIKNHLTKYCKVQEFLADHRLTRIKAVDFDVPLANKLVLWCLQNKKKSSHNYAVRIAQICQAVLNYGYTNGLIKFNNLYALKLKKKKPKAPIFLTPGELLAFENYTGKYKEYADMFLFQCYTGFDFADLLTVKKTDITTNPSDKRNYIIKPRSKSGIEAIIPYFKQTGKLWEKYDYCLKKISGDKYRKYLKEIAKELRITKNITSHTGRKTFAMIMLNYKNYSMESVSKIVGHASVKTTETYYAQVNINLISCQLDKNNAETI